MKKTIYFILLIIIVIVGWNYFGVNRIANDRLNTDPRNAGISILVHYRYLVFPNTLVIDLRNIKGEISQADVFRTLLQIAESQKSVNYSTVILSFRGYSKFYLKGQFFQTLGKDFERQNPIYTMRIFPSNLYLLNHELAYDSGATGGLLWVLARQMENFDDFSKRWYLDEFLEGKR